jgi:hypothetical protein
MFRSYKSVPREVKAIQYFAYMVPDIEGFSSVERNLNPDPNNPLAATDVAIVGGQILTGDKDVNGKAKVIHIPPGHYIVKESNGEQFKIMPPKDFEYHFAEVTQK